MGFSDAKSMLKNGLFAFSIVASLLMTSGWGFSHDQRAIFEKKLQNWKYAIRKLPNAYVTQLSSKSSVTKDFVFSKRTWRHGTRIATVTERSEAAQNASGTDVLIDVTYGALDNGRFCAMFRRLPNSAWSLSELALVRSEDYRSFEPEKMDDLRLNVCSWELFVEGALPESAVVARFVDKTNAVRFDLSFAIPDPNSDQLDNTYGLESLSVWFVDEIATIPFRIDEKRRQRIDSSTIIYENFVRFGDLDVPLRKATYYPGWADTTPRLYSQQDIVILDDVPTANDVVFSLAHYGLEDPKSAISLSWIWFAAFGVALMSVPILLAVFRQRKKK